MVGRAGLRKAGSCKNLDCLTSNSGDSESFGAFRKVSNRVGPPPARSGAPLGTPGDAKAIAMGVPMAAQNRKLFGKGCDADLTPSRVPASGLFRLRKGGAL
jgi:hypothetical protein